MKRLQKLIPQTNDLTLKIEREYPELYQHLNDSPVTIPCHDHPRLNIKIFSEYLDNLKQLLEHYIENHPKPNL